jgi:plasmid stability protein
VDDELIIPDLSDKVIAALQLRADEHDCTLEEEVCRILWETVDEAAKITDG